MQRKNGAVRIAPARRTTQRPRSARVEGIKRIPAKKRDVTVSERRVWRGTATLLLGGACLLAAIIGSELIYSDLPWLRIGHLFGPSGVAIGGSMLRWFGFGAFILPVCFWLFGTRTHRKSCSELTSAPPPMTWRSVAVSVLGSMFSGSLLLGLFGGARGGGVVGVTLAEHLSGLIGPGGTFLAASSLLFVLAPLITGHTMLASSKMAVTRVGFGARHVFVTMPRALVFSPVRQMSRFGVAASRRIVQMGHRLFFRSPEPIILKAVIEQGRPLVSSPKRRLLREAIDSSEETSRTITEDRRIPIAVLPPESARRIPLKDRVLDNYVFPQAKLLAESDRQHEGEDGQELQLRAQRIEEKLADFNIKGRIVQYQRGPVVSLFEFEPAPGVKLGRIVSLQDDLAMSLRASVVRIVAPIPGKGTVGIEVPNPRRDVVRLRELLESEESQGHQSRLAIPLGKDISGLPVVVDIATMPHLLIAGATGTGKSVCLNAILVSLLYRATPQELGLIMIDPKVLELSVYDGIPHLRVPVVTVPKQAKAVLEWAAKEMDRRYRLMQRFGVRNIDSFNRVVRGESDPEERGENQSETHPSMQDSSDNDADRDGVIGRDDAPAIPGDVVQPLPKIVIVVDELADLMLQVGRDIEELITRLAQKARAAGIHLILATQRPSVDVITGLIKANFPARLSFRVTSRIDSRTILDSMGAERLLGKGDMLFMAPGANPLRRIHGAFVTDAEVNRVVNAIKSKEGPRYDETIVAFCEAALREDGGEGEEGAEGEGEYDPLYDKAVELVVDKQHASTSLVQRVFRIGYNRAARIIERMERDGIVSQMDGARPREVLVHHRPGEGVN
jgi:S-DNA-T family DNA segregation ATPase FtsK/SpoIIIE